MKVICNKTIKDCFERSKLFTKGLVYEFIPVDNKYSKRNKFVGYFVKDNESNKRWCTNQFKNEYFTELD